ncbi:MAG: phosphodiesterase [Spiribacter salinus]|uniref:Phosphodiesterase n=1 Tax=Spiribacter salinus TaxID=1335746 RepID=A0A540VPX6_9GAMM|nr:MAG: phosphodiesterase [Spiribacter salinus]
MTRILQISDLHIMPEGQLFHGKIDTAAALQDMLTGLAGLLPVIGPVERLVISGDLTETGCEGAYDHLRAIMEKAPLPWCAIPGNHDSRAAMRAFAAGADWMPGDGPINWREDLDDVTILGLDTLVEGAAHGSVSEQTLEWLTATLRDLAGRPVLVFMHHPPFATGITAMDAIGLTPHPRLEAVLRDHVGPVQIACGHVHRMIKGQYAGRQVTIAPGTSHAVGLNLQIDAGPEFIPRHSGAILHDIGLGWRSLLISPDDFC